MKRKIYDLDPRTNLNLIDDHQTKYDQLYECHLLPFSTSENFQYSLENKEHPDLEFIVKFNKHNESMFIISTADEARCRLKMTETKLSYHLGNISIQRFADCLVSLELKTGYGIFARYRNIVNGKFNIDDLEDRPEVPGLLEIIVDMRYAASKASNIYRQLKDA